MYLQPQGITDALLATMARHANICDYLDIPLQHASARVLADMNRRGNAEDYLALLARIRAVLPEVTLRTTVIAGFPGETRAEARELERFIAQAAFDYVGVFPYSQEDGTAAGERPDQVPPRTRRARAQRLRDVADAIGFERIAAQVGRVEEVLITDYDEDVLAVPPGALPGTGDAVGATGTGTGAGGAPGTDAGTGGERTAPPPQNYPLLGRTKRQAPEVDGMVHLDCGTRGELVSATMVEAYCYELDGRVTAGDV
jgi:ribosomal protein S12 methylthiotransferase